MNLILLLLVLPCLVFGFVLGRGPSKAHGCLLKPGMKAGGGRYGDPPVSATSPEACGELCSRKERCNSFTFANDICHFRNNLDLKPTSQEGYTAGWCPKGEPKKVKEDETFQPSMDALKCNDTGFNQMHYHGPVLVHENEHKYTGVSSKEECQTLCQIAERCNFFQFSLVDGLRSCTLMSAVGHKMESNTGEHHFGPKLCPGGAGSVVGVVTTIAFLLICSAGLCAYIRLWCKLPVLNREDPECGGATVPLVGAGDALEAFTGRFKRVSTEQFENFIKVLNLEAPMNPMDAILEIGEAGGWWTLKSSSALLLLSPGEFLLGKKFSETTADGREVETLVTFEDGKILGVQTAKKEGERSSKFTMELSGTKELVFSMTMEGAEDTISIHRFRRI